DEAAQHELVSRLPSQPRPEPASSLGGHQHAMDASARRRRAGRPARKGTSGQSADRVLGVPPVSRTYWRSLAQLDDTKEYRDALEREFPEGASELPDGISRRDMMMLLGASLSLAGLAGCRRPVEEIVPYVSAPEDTLPGIPRHYATTMPFRRSAYGLIVE